MLTKAVIFRDKSVIKTELLLSAGLDLEKGTLLLHLKVNSCKSTKATIKCLQTENKGLWIHTGKCICKEVTWLSGKLKRKTLKKK